MAGEKDLGNLTDNGIVGISISGTGDVGINTTTPTQLLDVNGNMNMSTRFCISARRASQSPHYVTRRTF